MADRYLCLECGEVYNHWFPNDMVRCPKSNCNGPVVEIDELMIPVIWHLNNFCGFDTRFCCSGHLHEDSRVFGAYINFTSEGWDKLIFANPDFELPETWYLDKDSEYHTIRNVELDSKRVWMQRDRYCYWLKFMNDITQWAYDLRPVF